MFDDHALDRANIDSLVDDPSPAKILTGMLTNKSTSARKRIVFPYKSDCVDITALRAKRYIARDINL